LFKQKKKQSENSVSPAFKSPFHAAASSASKKSKTDNDVIEIDSKTKSTTILTETSQNSPSTNQVSENCIEKNLKIDDVERKESDDDLNLKTSKNEKNEKNKKGKKASETEDKDKDEEEVETSSIYKKEDFIKTSNGKEYNFKITSWNINGIRAWIEVLFFFFLVKTNSRSFNIFFFLIIMQIEIRFRLC
jgi:rare lipoprotein A (peptidoglycan hydrolase)